MSARRPDRRQRDYAVPASQLKPSAGAKRGRADQLASKIEPFYVSGGQSYWVYDIAAGFVPIYDAVQLVTSVYVPNGAEGFIKELRCAPYCPSSLCDPWTTSGISNDQASYRTWDRQQIGNEGAPIPDMGELWKSPMGWEAAFDDDSEALPTWTWWLRFYQGNITTLRSQMQNIPPFSVSDPASWYLVPNIPVPATAYSGGLPGNPAGPSWSPQRMQVLPGDKNSVHLPVPPDTTVLLFARWTQSDVQPYGFAGSTYVSWGPRVPPIGPSVGSIVGYTQSLNSAAAADNIQKGWGG